MRGGKFLNNWRMAELHAKGGAGPGLELRPTARRSTAPRWPNWVSAILGGHTYPRLAHVGDRTGLELIHPAAKGRLAAADEDTPSSADYEARIKVFAECTITELLMTMSPEYGSAAGSSCSRGARWRCFLARRRRLVVTSCNPGRQTGDGTRWHCCGPGDADRSSSVHPTAWCGRPVLGNLVTEGVQDGGVLKNSRTRFMFDYIVRCSRASTPRRKRPTSGLRTTTLGPTHPGLVAPRRGRAINSEVVRPAAVPHAVCLPLTSHPG